MRIGSRSLGEFPRDVGRIELTGPRRRENSSARQPHAERLLSASQDSVTLNSASPLPETTQRSQSALKVAPNKD